MHLNKTCVYIHTDVQGQNTRDDCQAKHSGLKLCEKNEMAITLF